jgi:hypothetical protein
VAGSDQQPEPTRNHAIARARAHRKAHAGFAPDCCRTTKGKKNRKALQALGDGIGWASRLEMAGPGLRMYTVDLVSLELDDLETPWTNLLDRRHVATIKTAILEVFEGPIWVKLEAGYHVQRIHAHVLAHQAPAITSRKTEPYSLDGLLRYLYKSAFPGDHKNSNLEAANLEIEGWVLLAQDHARRVGSRLPKLSFARGIPRG